MSAGWIVGLADAAAADVATVGGKGAGLHRLVALGARVPAGFVVTTDAFRAALDTVAAQVEAPLQALGPDAPIDAVERAAAQARARLLRTASAGPVLEEVRAAYDDLAGGIARVAVRSSAVGEDAAGASFAGEHDTFLEIRGRDAVADAVCRCWASLYTARAVSYREHAGAGPAGAMAVVVQEMVPARAAGVFMTLNPANGDRSTVVCEAVWGLGEPLVSGAVTPDRFVVDKVSGEVVRREIADKPRQLVRGEMPGTAEVDVSAERRGRPCLDDAELAELLDLARRVERDAGVPQDGEFAVAEPGGPARVHLLQTRPETVWSTRAPRAATNGSGARTALSAVLATLTRGAAATSTTPEGTPDHGG
ncbi:PEP/pyruvate-binding domain-containing protein [Actinomycetospora straminea]|uniref:Phosphoenolpyruvate synthase n=1 Tax=Actinomycetospora straminea TaxID=663607 RepID=A0ABP9E220_9PSEU|nr:PEP/pyruvate-binding domain-containing protein [Actinomycetospora straminea]MDD7932381.1 PEP/pyruvate-binding domain-containing protein [Actinomycetospora straminea]